MFVDMMHLLLFKSKMVIGQLEEQHKKEPEGEQYDANE